MVLGNIGICWLLADASFVDPIEHRLVQRELGVCGAPHSSVVLQSMGDVEMKKAWLVWEYSDHVDIDNLDHAQIVMEEPDRYHSWAKVREIVWCMIEE